ncbi:MAG: DUF192 domain-containing protein [Alphaproteobacteria bacterium]|nr:MAG: DUF192 domain-containing protein [Alphaproteobacteria bacterium]
MIRRMFPLALVALIALIPVWVHAQLPSQMQSFTREPLVIVSGTQRHSFEVEMALTPAQQQQGLMFRRTMPAMAGMLFLHQEEREQAMWMMNTFIPLDMVFIRRDGRISHIVERTVPHSTATISSNGPVLAVLELNGGTVARLGIKVGDRVDHRGFAR